MLKNKKSVIFSLIFLFTAVFLAAQSSATADLTKRFLERANTEYENAKYDDAYKTINAALKLNDSYGIPANVTLIATQVYTKVLQNIKSSKNYSKLSDVTANLEKYPVIADANIQRLVKDIYAQQEAELQAKKDAAEKAERAEQRAMYQEQLEEQRKSQASFMEAMQASQETVMSSIVDLGDKMAGAAQESARSNHMVLVAVLIICVALVIAFIVVIAAIRSASKASVRQSMQFEETLKLVHGMQQTNSQLLLGNVTDLNSLGGSGLRSAGSSRWGVDALPAPEMNDEEKEELKQLAIKCEELGVKIDAASRRKNNSKNVSELVYKLAVKLGCNQNTAMAYFCASMVYDAGFLAIPEEVMDCENLTDEQKKLIKEHVTKSEDYFDFVPDLYRKIFDDAARYHHENEDGSGYPNGIKGDIIPQIAKIIHVVESYNSLISRRNYKQIMDKESAIEELLQKADKYDKVVVEALDSIV